MAGGARELPKWQPLANPVPNELPNWQQQILCQKKSFFPSIFLFAFDDIYCIIAVEKVRDRMIRKVPKVSTIRGRIHAYAYKCGFTIVTQADGRYYIFDRKMGYTTHRNLSMDDVVRIVTDELYTMVFRNNPSLVRG